MKAIFTKTKSLIMKIDSFIDLSSEAALHFKEAILLYSKIDRGNFENRLGKIRDIENRADLLKQDIESQLYTHTLIPESRGDVLGIIESMDKVTDSCKNVIVEFSIEEPQIPDLIMYQVLNLTSRVTEAIENLAAAARAYFYDVSMVNNYLHKVKFFETESDHLAIAIKKEIFKMDMELAQKLQVGKFIDKIDRIADIAEDVSDRISIASIKRIV